MLTYVRKIVAPDEQILYVAMLHWIIYFQALVFIAAGGLIAYFIPQIIGFMFGSAALDTYTRPVGLVAAVIVFMGLTLLLGSYIRQASTELVITDRRVIAKYGFISRSTFELMISRITGVNFDQSVLARILNYGTIIVHGAGSDISPIGCVADPRRFHKELTAAIEQAQGSVVVQHEFKAGKGL
ncbi:MAG: PH domain-containing protein [Bdellovibrionales bacterium]